MRPSFFHKDMTGVYPTLRLGWLSTYFVAFETITGLILMVWLILLCNTQAALPSRRDLPGRDDSELDEHQRRQPPPVGVADPGGGYGGCA